MLANRDQVQLVDRCGRGVGECGKLAAHQEPARLHRAFSIFLFDESDRLLLQQRAAQKYHFGGLWTNTCCSHPAPGEGLAAAAGRRLLEELGLRSMLTPIGTLLYRTRDLETGLLEYELDHLLYGGDCRDSPVPAPDEISAVRWVSGSELSRELSDAERFTPWFVAAMTLHPRLARWLGRAPGAGPPTPSHNRRWVLEEAVLLDLADVATA